MNDEIRRFAIVFMPINFGICLIVTLVLLLSFKDNSYAFGYLLGSLTSYLTFILHMRYVRDVGNEKPNILVRLLTNFGVRSLIWIAVLFIAYKFNNYFNLYTTGIGLVVINLFVFIFGIVYLKRNMKPKMLPKKDHGGDE